MNSELVSIQYLDKSRGRGLVAKADFAAGETLLCVPYDIAVLYTPFVRNTCYRCFEASLEEENNKNKNELRYECTSCKHLVLCSDCVNELVSEVQEVSPCSVSADSLLPSQAHELIQHHRLLQAHRMACGWFCGLPESTREGDTDYLRFALEVASRTLLGDTQLRLALEELCMNVEQQSKEVRQFFDSFARKVIDRFRPEGLDMDVRYLSDILLRTKFNSIGFPFNEEETLGWTLERVLCMINHSCVPNAAIVRSNRETSSKITESQAKKSGNCCMKLVARFPIKAGEEITIAYIDVDGYGGDAQARSQQLMESYGFLCKCDLCIASTANKS
ncbi:SET domain [Trypanosoma melophagium]|uniref:SET domain n=1 Tax=Trypanosoma melophagium TaxID=715481 RepID=UPI00351A9E4D|nr:SET domain [Trypanosoma melophagium]